MTDNPIATQVSNFLKKTVGQTQLSFDQVCHRFSTTFPALPERVMALNALLSLARAQRLPLAQKLAAQFILLRPDHFGAEQRSMIENPFLPALVDQIKSDVGSGQTAGFLCDLIFSTGHENSQKIGCKTPAVEVEEIADEKMLEFSSGKIAEKMHYLKKALEKSQSSSEVADPVFELAEKIRVGDPFSEICDFANFPHFSYVFPPIDHPCDKAFIFRWKLH